MRQGGRKSLRDFPILSFPTGELSSHFGNRLIHLELHYNIHELDSEFQTLISALTASSEPSVAQVGNDTNSSCSHSNRANHDLNPEPLNEGTQIATLACLVLSRISRLRDT
ncbi:hypothetical protein JHK82_048202 [Glycine max]|nr:hypothetical protein JHK82_048202 [Glycine max]